MFLNPSFQQESQNFYFQELVGVFPLQELGQSVAKVYRSGHMIGPFSLSGSNSFNLDVNSEGTKTTTNSSN